MQIHHLKIANFRGIRTLDWHLRGRTICLIGPNDATKTTILDAIELALLPRASLQLSDADFFEGQIDQPILIEVTVGELPPEQLVEPEKFGLLLRGYHAAEGLKDDPGNGAHPVLTIRFEMGKDFESVWTVVKPATDESKRIGWQDRERLGLTRLGEEVERQLTWSRGSSLARLTAKGGSTAQALMEATRNARQVIADSPLIELNEAAAKARTAAGLFGVEVGELKAGLDAVGFSLGASVLGLHEEGVPMRLAGLGTKRLAALAIQQSEAGQSSILLVDEIEHGLEPHRIRHVLSRLTRRADGQPRSEGQVIFTTHSPTSVMVLAVEAVRFVRTSGGQTAVVQGEPGRQDTLQGIARSHAHAFFGRKLLVGEGATEVGLCRGLEERWCEQHDGRHPTHLGFIALDGKGRTNAPPLAIELKRLGFSVAVFGDSDQPLQPSPAELLEQGIPTFVWDGAMSTEVRIFNDLPWTALQVLVNVAAAELGEESLHGQVGHYANRNLAGAGLVLAGWLAADFTENQIRTALGAAAHAKGWFKNVTLGTVLGETVAGSWAAVADKPLGLRLAEIAAWVYAG